MGFKEVKNELQKLDKTKLIALLGELYTKNAAVKEYLDFYGNPDFHGVFEKYKAKVYEAFYPKGGFNYSLSTGKQAITAFKKLEPSAELLADLMLLYVETGVKFTREFGDINEAFYSSLESTFASALKLMKKEDILEKFRLRAEQIVLDTRNMGWGFHNYLSDVFGEYYGN